MKKISKSQMNALYKADVAKTKTQTVTCGDKTITVELSIPSLKTVDTVVDTVLSSCFVDNEYYPQYYDVVVFAMMLQHITNIDMPVDADGNIDLETVYQWMTVSNLHNAVYYSAAGSCIAEACYAAVEWKKQQVLNHNKLDELIEKFGEISEAFENEDFQSAMTALAEAQKAEA